MNSKTAKPHTGSSFDAFLREEGIADEVTAHGLQRAIAEQLREQTAAQSDAQKFGTFEAADPQRH